MRTIHDHRSGTAINLVARLILGLSAAWVVVVPLSNGAMAQTTRTNPSAGSTTSTIPSSSSTSPNTPCSSFNPTSPCYSGKLPRNPCYSAVAPDQPCSTTTTPQTPTSPPPLRAATKPTVSTDKVHALTRDQAITQIEAQGFTKVTGLERDSQGVWRGKAEKDGIVSNVTLDRDGNVSSD